MAKVQLQALPFDEAIKALRTRRDNPLPSGRWQEVYGEEHAIAGTVARSAGFDILGDVFASLDQALAKGETFETWKKDITPTLQAKGWWGKQVVDGEVVQLGSPHRLRTIYDVNMRVSRSAGRWEQIQRVKARRPWLRYSAVQDERTRQSHKSWHGTVLPVDDPWWDSHYPPNGWRCRCTVQQLSDRDLKRYGHEPSPAAPDDGTRTWRNPATGDVVEVPKGIDPGWSHNVGRARETGLQALEKAARLPARASAAAGKVVPVDQVAGEYEAWAKSLAKQIDSGKVRTKGEAKAIGSLSTDVVNRLKEMDLEPANAQVWLSDKRLAHLMRDAKAEARTPSGLPKSLPRADVWRLAEALDAPEAVYWDSREKTVVIVFDSTSDERPDDQAKVAVRLDDVGKEKAPPARGTGQGTKRRTVKRNMIVTAGWERSFPAPRYVRLDED